VRTGPDSWRAPYEQKASEFLAQITEWSSVVAAHDYPAVADGINAKIERIKTIVNDSRRRLTEVRDLWNKVQVQSAAATNFSVVQSRDTDFERYVTARIGEMENERQSSAETAVADFNRRGLEIQNALDRIQGGIRPIADLAERRGVLGQLIGELSKVNRQRGELALRASLIAKWGLQDRLLYNVNSLKAQIDRLDRELKAQLRPLDELIHAKNEYEAHARTALNTLNELQAKVGGRAEDDSVPGLVRQVQEIESLPGSRSFASVQAKWELLLRAFQQAGEPAPQVAAGLSLDELNARSRQLEGAVSSARSLLLWRLRGAKDSLFAKATSDFQAIQGEAERIASNVTKDNRHAQRARYHEINDHFQQLVVDFQVPSEALVEVDPGAKSRIDDILSLQQDAQDSLEGALAELNQASLKWSVASAGSVLVSPQNTDQSGFAAALQMSISAQNRGGAAFGDEPQTAIIDFGTGYCKAGFAGDESPIGVIPTVVGRPSYNRMGVLQQRDVYVGNEALSKRFGVQVRYPMDHGDVTNWDDMTKVFDDLMRNQLGVLPEETPVLATESPWWPEHDRQKFVQICFELYNVPSFYLAATQVLGLYAARRGTGLVVDVGHSITAAVPIYEGCALRDRIRRINVAGDDVTNWLIRILNFDRGYNFTSTGEKEAIRRLKERVGYVAMNYDAELRQAQMSRDFTESHTLPDGSTIDVTEERFKAPELLFKPSLNGLRDEGITQLVLTTVGKCDPALRRELLGNVVLSGGGSMFQRLPERLEAELQRAAPGEAIKVIAISDRQFSTFLGGSILASLTTFPEMAVTPGEYNEFGPTIVTRKCF
jgi:actin beta/gamma 1